MGKSGSKLNEQQSQLKGFVTSEYSIPKLVDNIVTESGSVNESSAESKTFFSKNKEQSSKDNMTLPIPSQTKSRFSGQYRDEMNISYDKKRRHQRESKSMLEKARRSKELNSPDGEHRQLLHQRRQTGQHNFLISKEMHSAFKSKSSFSNHEQRF